MRRGVTIVREGEAPAEPHVPSSDAKSRSRFGRSLTLPHTQPEAALSQSLSTVGTHNPPDAVAAEAYQDGDAEPAQAGG